MFSLYIREIRVLHALMTILGERFPESADLLYEAQTRLARIKKEFNDQIVEAGLAQPGTASRIAEILIGW